MNSDRSISCRLTTLEATSSKGAPTNRMPMKQLG
jgi:hypothetical protein